MTPEERAAMVARNFCVCTCYAPRSAPSDNRGPLADGSHYVNCPTDDEAIAVIEIAKAIREAVKAEREACAKIADETASRWDSQPDDDCASIACGDIATAIRERPL